MQPLAKRKLQALGRLKPGEMNKTEQAFNEYLKHQLMRGEILWYGFEVVKLKIANNTHITVDFFILDCNQCLKAIDVKGSKHIVTDDAKVKMKVAAKEFPWPFFYAFPQPARNGGGWVFEEI